MSRPVKFLIGFACAMLAGWGYYGPAGQAEKLTARIETDARNLVAQAELEGATVRLEREPLSRDLVLSGQANDLQREGLGSGLGVKDYARATPNVGQVRWDDEPKAFSLPLLAETLIVAALAWLAGLLLGTLFFNRRERHSFLD
jgi:hypothetical protein